MFSEIIIQDECSPNDLYMKEYFGIPIISPRSSVAFYVNKKMEDHVRLNFKTGVYRDYTQIKDILNSIFNILKKDIDELICKISNIDVIETMFEQYSRSSKIEIYAREKPQHNDAISWNEDRRCLRRSLKFIIEKMAETYQSNKHCSFDGYFINVEKLIKCVETCFELSSLSSTVYGLYQEKVFFEIYEPSENPFDPFFFLKIDGFDEEIFKKSTPLFHEFNKRNGSLFYNYQEYFEEKTSVAFSELSEDSYENFWMIIWVLFNNCKPRDSGVFFIPAQKLKDMLRKNFKISSKCIELFFNTFSLTQEKLRQSPREIYKTKQKQRLKIKFILQIVQNGVLYFMYTYEMMDEALNFFRESLRYNDLPEEWKSPSMQKSFSQISRHFGSVFESYARKHLFCWNFKGEPLKKSLPCGIKIPNDVGEIDFLGYSENQKCIVCFEFKDVRCSTDPLDFKDDLDKFIYKEKSYLSKYLKKINFVKKHLSELVEYYKKTSNIELTTREIAISFITYVPNIAGYFIRECKCMSISEFEIEWKNNPQQFMISI